MVASGSTGLGRPLQYLRAWRKPAAKRALVNQPEFLEPESPVHNQLTFVFQTTPSLFFFSAVLTVSSQTDRSVLLVLPLVCAFLASPISPVHY